HLPRRRDAAGRDDRRDLLRRAGGLRHAGRLGAPARRGGASPAMNAPEHCLSRRTFLAGAAGALAQAGDPPARRRDRALVAITLDLEMSRNFPTWDQTHWDYEKGNLNDETKRYTVEACRRVRRHGGVAHCFLVGRALEQADVGWLREILRDGHAVGNHTYDHVNVRAEAPEQ